MPFSDTSETNVHRTLRKTPLGWGIVAALGLAGWLACLAFRDAPQAWRALLVNFIFFTPLSAALVVWPAVVMLSRGRWMGHVQQDGLGGIAMAPVSLAALGGLWLGRAHWAGGWLTAGGSNSAWLNETFLFARDGAALLLWWAVAFAFVVRARKGRPTALAGWLAFLYAVTFSLLAFDLVMALDPRWVSALFGGYFFITGLYAAMALLTFLAAQRRGPDPDRLQDLGKLVVTFSIMTTYLMFSQLLPIWYENLPHEVPFVIARIHNLPWSAVSLALLTVVYLGPLVLLLPSRAKRAPGYLGAVSLLVLAGLWVERWWLVMPTLGQEPRVNAADLSLCAAFIGALGWGIGALNRRRPDTPEKADGRE